MSGDTKHIPGLIANAAIDRLRGQGLDCVNPSAWGNTTAQIHDAVFFAAKDVLEGQKAKV